MRVTQGWQDSFEDCPHWRTWERAESETLRPLSRIRLVLLCFLDHLLDLPGCSSDEAGGGQDRLRLLLSRRG